MATRTGCSGRKTKEYMEYKLDRTTFKMQTFEEAANDFEYWNTKSDKEKLSAAMYLNSVAFDFPLNNPPRLDRTFFRMTRRMNE